MRLDTRLIGLGTGIVAWALLGSAVDRADSAPASDPAPRTSADAGAVTVSDDPEMESEKKEIKGSDSKGKYWFKKDCKECHGKDGDGGEVTPIAKTIKQWERFFKKGKHTDEEALLDVVDEEKLIHIETFLINHAADSDQPETCG